MATTPRRPEEDSPFIARVKNFADDIANSSSGFAAAAALRDLANTWESQEGDGDWTPERLLKADIPDAIALLREALDVLVQAEGGAPAKYDVRRDGTENVYRVDVQLSLDITAAYDEGGDDADFERFEQRLGGTAVEFVQQAILEVHDDTEWLAGVGSRLEFDLKLEAQGLSPAVTIMHVVPYNADGDYHSQQ